jgi:phage repressor protein C with HTH and peptisase S24 domain
MFGFHLFVVHGKSMEPSFFEGDFVVAKLASPEVGNVVIANWRGNKIIKKIISKNRGMYVLRGENQVDGKIFHVEKKDVLGKVVLRIKTPSKGRYI